MRPLRALQRLARWVVGDYQVFAIMAAECEAAAPSESAPLAVFSTPEAPAPGSGYGGEGAYGFAWAEDGRRQCYCWVWVGERYRRDRNFWPLAADEGKLISLETAPEARGRGLAPRLIRFARQEMGRRGFRRLYARVWHSNAPSLRAFAKDGWWRHATVIELYPLGRRLRFVLRHAKHRPAQSPPAQGATQRQPDYS